MRLSGLQGLPCVLASFKLLTRQLTQNHPRMLSRGTGTLLVGLCVCGEGVWLLIDSGPMVGDANFKDWIKLAAQQPSMGAFVSLCF